MKIYVITVCTHLELEKTTQFPYFGAERICGYYMDFKDAYRAVTENMCDIWEHTYGYAYIETVEEGLYPSSKDRWFFKFDTESMMYQEIEEPKFLEHFSGLSFG